MNKLIPAIKAGYPYFYAQSFEMSRSIEIITKEVEEYGKLEIKTWDFTDTPDPMEVIQILEKNNSILIGKNFNWFLKDEYNVINKDIVSYLQNNVDKFSSAEARQVLIIISNDSFSKAIPEVLQKDFFSLDFNFPDENEIEKILNKIIDDVKGNPNFIEPNEEEKKKIILSSKGLTRRELVNGYSFAIVKDKGKILPETIAELQAKEIEKTAGLKIGRYTDSFDMLKGYDNLKEFCLSTIYSNLAKGIMILGPPGTGKTQFCKCLGAETKMKVIEMEMAELFGSLVGESERLMKDALEIISTNSPCILFIDEIEKGLAGVNSNQTGDGGTTKRSMGQFLKFLSDSRPKGIYVIATCNNIASLPPEWIRAERWDCAPFFIDLPSEEEQEAILDHYKKFYTVKGDPKTMEGWSGAEVKACCRIASMMGKSLNEVEKFIVPISKTMATEIDQLRKWSAGKTIPASILKEKKKGRRIDI